MIEGLYIGTNIYVMPSYQNHQTHNMKHECIYASIYLHNRFWISLVLVLSSMVQFILVDLLFFIMNIIVTFPVSLPWLVKGTIPELKSLANCELVARLAGEAKFATTLNFLVDQKLALDLLIEALPTGVSL